MRTARGLVAIAAVAVLAAGCAARQKRHFAFDGSVIEGDVELSTLTDEELFAAGSAAFAGSDFKQAARYFGRIADFHPKSPHHRPATFNAGVAHQRLKEWDEAYMRFTTLAEPERGTGDALEASFKLAETLYQMERYDDALRILSLLANRADLPKNRRMEATVQLGICELESGNPDAAEATLRRAVAMYNEAPDSGEIDNYFPAQAQFFIGEIYRLHYESVTLDPEKGVDPLAKDLELKAELLLSAQGHYLRSIRMGNGYWATAAGAQIGTLYQNLYEHMVNAPAPSELNEEQAEIYKVEIRKKIRVLIRKAIGIYEQTLEAAERLGSVGPFVERARESLQRMKELLVADGPDEEAIS